MNGHSSDMNLDAAARSAASAVPNGAQASAFTSMGLPRDELLRLLVQALDSLGFPEVAGQLESRSGVRALSDLVQAFRRAVLGGQWDDLERLLPEMDRLAFKSPEAARLARFTIYKQMFLELLEAGQTSEALRVLQSQMTPCITSTQDRGPEAFSRNSKYPDLHRLTTLLLCRHPSEIRSAMGLSEDLAFSETRDHVLQRLHQYVLPSMLLPDHRLETLLLRQLEHQRVMASWPYTVQTGEWNGLLEDFTFAREKLPRMPILRLNAHDDEVWFVVFNHTGTRLASASRDKSVIIWDISWGPLGRNASVLRKLEGHPEPLSFLAWSPDDTQLLSCSSDRAIRLWEVETGIMLATFMKHGEAVTAVAWLPDNRRFISGSLDTKLHMWDTMSPADPNQVIEEPIWTFAHGTRINDLGVTPDGRRLVVICSEKRIRIIDLVRREEVLGADGRMIREVGNVTSMCLSQDGRSLLVNISSQDAPEIHCWDLEERYVQRYYTGHKQNRFVIRSCFGGDGGVFVVSGSEDYMIYVYHRETAKVIDRLSGHGGVVNSVSWNPKVPGMLASASDDKSVILWGTP